MRGEQNDTVQRILRSNEWLMSVLHAARAVDLPDWFVGAGAIRNPVWDYLHGYTVPTPLADRAGHGGYNGVACLPLGWARSGESTDVIGGHGSGTSRGRGAARCLYRCAYRGLDG